MQSPSNPSYNGYVYLIGSRRFGWYKIGKANDPSIRVKHLGILLPFKIQIYGLWMTPNPLFLEHELHEKYWKKKINGEWFSFTWEEIADVITSPTKRSSVFIPKADQNFSNIESEIIVDGFKGERRKLSKEFMVKVMKYIEDNDLEPTRENKKIGRSYVAKTIREGICKIPEKIYNPYR
jgi:hypothetical protein